MDHQFRAEGFGLRLRPVALGDAAFIVWVRNLEHVRGRIGDSAVDVPEQEAWLRKYLDRPGDYYFLIETKGGLPVGTYGFSDLRGGSAESGRWVVRPEVPAAIPSAILCLDLAFEQLQLKFLRVRTVSTNTTVLSLNRKFGMRQTHVEKDSVKIGGQWVDQVAFTLDPADWLKARAPLLPLAQVAERQILDWERNQ